MNGSQPTFLFILGRGRSGTSLLQTILNAHPQISVAPEAQFIMFLRKRYQHGKWDTDRVRQFSNDLWLEERLQNWHLDKNILSQELSQLKVETNFANLCKEVYYQYGLSKNKQDLKVVGDKNPHYALYIKHLIKLYPNAKFVHLVRDPRDTVLSYKEVNFDSNNTATLAWRWNIYNRAILKYRKKMPAKFFFLKFEDLLESPEATLSNLCHFLGVEYNPEMLNFYKKEQDWEAEFRKNLKKPLDPAKAYQWKRKMKPKQVRYTNTITAKMATSFGYGTLEKKNELWVKVKSFPNQLYARWVTFLEKVVYLLPLWLVAPLISFYRKITAPDAKNT